MTSSSEGLMDPDVPMHHQIYMRLRMDIIDGLWTNRNDFPGEDELAARFDVSNITSRRALERLAQEGYLRRGRGRRTTVIYQPADERPPNPAPMMMPVHHDLYRYQVLAMGKATVPEEACRAFDVAPGSTLWSCTRLRRFEGRLHSVAQSVQPIELGEKHSFQALSELPMISIVRAAGIEITRLRKRIGVGLPSSEVARHLGISLQSPTLVHSYILSDENDQNIDWVRIFLHPQESLPWEVFNLKSGTVEDMTVL